MKKREIQKNLENMQKILDELVILLRDDKYKKAVDGKYEKRGKHGN